MDSRSLPPPERLSYAPAETLRLVELEVYRRFGLSGHSWKVTASHGQGGSIDVSIQSR